MQVFRRDHEQICSIFCLLQHYLSVCLPAVYDHTLGQKAQGTSVPSYGRLMAQANAILGVNAFLQAIDVS